MCAKVVRQCVCVCVCVCTLLPCGGEPAELHTTTLIASLHSLLHSLQYFNEYVIGTIHILHRLKHLHCSNGTNKNLGEMLSIVY